MERASVAQEATLYDIPFVVIRAVSYNNSKESKTIYEKFEAMAAANSVKIVRAMLSNIK